MCGVPKLIDIGLDLLKLCKNVTQMQSVDSGLFTYDWWKKSC